MTISRSGESYAGRLSGGALQDALENSPDCVLVLDLAGTVQSVNLAGVQLLGQKGRAELLGNGWQALWIAADQGEATSAVAAAAAGAPQRLVLSFSIRNEEQRRLDCVLTPLRNPAGAPSALLVVMRDMAEREAERIAAIQQSVILRSGAEIAKLAGWEVDFRRDAVLVVGGGEDRAAYETTFEKSLAMYDPEDRARIRELYARGRRNGERVRYDAPIQRPDGTRGWVRALAEPLYVDGECVGFRGAGMDISEAVAAQEVFERAKQRLNLVVQLAGMQVYEIDFERRILIQEGSSEAIFDRLLRYEDFEKDALNLVDPRDHARVGEEWAKALALRNPFRSEFRIQRRDRRERWVFCIAEVIDQSARRPTVVTAMIDITERKRSELDMIASMVQMRRHEAHQKLLLDELNHRVKNTLASVQSVAAQTLTAVRDPAQARELFLERLLALSHTHDLLVKHAWDGASFQEVAQAVLKPFGRTYRCSGPDLRLDPNFAVSLGMALHELAMNALKHGAWSADGQVEIATEAREGEVRITWRESGGPEVSPPLRRGFGSRLLQRGVAGELGGTVTLEFAGAGVVCCIEAPVSDRLHPLTETLTAHRAADR